MQQRYGATPEEWFTFDTLLGLTEDLLPVVSNPNAPISEKSKMKGLGKTPSWYNRSRNAAGISDWTKRKSSAKDIEKWSKEPDYGICLQTRNIRALDVDVSNVGVTRNIVGTIHHHLTTKLPPIRRRSTSAKCLLGFKLSGEIPKRILKLNEGIIEFLASGQQFIAAGTHPSGVRYEWEGLTEFPELTLDEFESLWSALVERFAIEPTSSKRLRKTGVSRAVHDEVLNKLLILDDGPQGQVHIVCPFSSEHTSDSGVSSTSYFPKGTNGYEQGSFVCLHAHCANRTTEDFLDALGIRNSELDSIPTKEVAKPWPAFKRTTAGEIHPIIDNLYHALRRDDVCSSKIAYDSFRDEVVITSTKTHALDWRPLGDNDYTILQRHLERQVGFKPIAVDLLRRAVYSVAYENTFDSAILWLEGLKWDGIPRVDNFMSRYMRSKQSPYAVAVSRYLWSALAGRVMSPGVQADMVPIWESGQGRIKSTTVEALAPDPEYFVEIDLSERETDLARKMRGKVVGEISELRGLQTKDEKGLLSFITRKHEEWVPKYMEKSRRFARRLVFIATTNDKEILTGAENRRWLPIRVEYADIAAIRRDRDQLWAEGKELFRRQGICFADAEKLARAVHKDYAVIDVWKETIEEWLATPEEKGPITTIEVMREALHLEARNLKGIESKRVAKALRELGYEHTQRNVSHRVQWIWLPPWADLV